MPYRVVMADNWHFMDPSEEYELGAFATLEEAKRAAEAAVDRNLAHLLKPGMTAAELVAMWFLAGDDPYIRVPEGEPRAGFAPDDANGPGDRRRDREPWRGRARPALAPSRLRPHDGHQVAGRGGLRGTPRGAGSPRPRPGSVRA